MRVALVALLALGVAGAAGPAAAQSSQLVDKTITGRFYIPQELEPTPESRQALRLPEGFRLSVFAEGLENPRMIAVGEDGTVYTTRRDIGDLVMLRDTNGDGRADEQRVIAARPDMHGIAIDGRRMYLTTIRDVYVTEIKDDGSVGELRRIIDDLPDGGQHANRTLAIGPDGMLYITVGSTCNACDETDQESATILRATLDGRQRTIYASGLRNTIGFDWHPQTGGLWAMDMGIDWLGDDDQPEELNELKEGQKYGWPHIYADGKVNPQDEPPGGISYDEWRRTSQQPTLMYTAHASPLQLVFYTADHFPEDYRGDAFVTFRGSWNRKPPSGYEVARIRFENGRAVRFEPFLTGFVQEIPGGHGHIGRLAGLAITNDGSLLVGDDTGGVIYRVTYEGPGGASRAGAEPTSGGGAPRAAAGTEGAGAPQLAMAAVGGEVPRQLEVTSDGVEAGRTLPARFAEDGEKISPSLRWSGAPEGTRSFVVIAEDPDAPGPSPFVHWLVYGIPPETTSLREALPTVPQLVLPEGVKQGRNSQGGTGWYGMDPVVGPPRHSYHFQVFALDRQLDLPAGADRDAVLAAMRGHILARGERVGTFGRG